VPVETHELEHALDNMVADRGISKIPVLKAEVHHEDLDTSPTLKSTHYITGEIKPPMRKLYLRNYRSQDSAFVVQRRG